jgi:hypothetical protein
MICAKDAGYLLLSIKKTPDREGRLGAENISINFYQYHHTTDYCKKCIDFVSITLDVDMTG